MPYSKESDHPQCPASEPIAVVKTATGEVMGCHANDGEANAQIAALNIAEEERGDRSMSAFEKFLNRLRSIVDDILNQERAWDGSPSRWPSTESYCNSSLINVNQSDDPDEWTQSHCMLPTKNPGSDSHDFEAIQAAAGGHGVTQVKKPDDVPQDEWDAAVKGAASAIINQYEANDQVAPDSVFEAAGKEPPEERAVNLFDLAARVDGELFKMDSWPWLHGLYFDDGGGMFGIASEEGRLFRFSVTMDDDGEVTLGEMEQVLEEFVPVAGRTRTTVFRDASDVWRWLSVSCTAILNRVGEIDTRALFDSFVEYARETGEYPFRTFYHCGEALKYGQCDFLARDGYCLITSGIFDVDGPNGDLALAEIQARQNEPNEWGESIQYKPTVPPEMVDVAEGVKVPAFNNGILREISNLPESDAAALFTGTTVQEVSRMHAKIQEAMRKLGIGDDRIDELAEQVDSTNRAASDPSVIARETEPPEPPVEEESAGEEEVPPEGDEPPSEEEVETQEVEIDDEVVEAIADRVMERLAPVIEETLTQVADTVGALEDGTNASLSLFDERLRQVERDDAQKIEQLREDMPRRNPLRVTYRPRVDRAEEQSGEGGGDREPGEPENYAEQAEKVVGSIKAAY